MKEIMKESFVTICICVMLCVLGVGFMFFVLELNEKTIIPVETVDNSVDNCEHDWVVVSEYHFWTQSWRNVSKCSKCGKVVK